MLYEVITLIIGEEELGRGEAVLRDMQTSAQTIQAIVPDIDSWAAELAQKIVSD